VITGTSATASFGSLVTINLASPVTFAGATSFQVYAGGAKASSVTTLGTATTVYPAQTSGSTMQVEFLNAAGTQVGTTQNVTLRYTSSFNKLYLVQGCMKLLRTALLLTESFADS